MRARIQISNTHMKSGQHQRWSGDMVKGGPLKLIGKQPSWTESSSFRLQVQKQGRDWSSEIPERNL